MTQVKCICSKCNTEALSTPGTQHRRCGGQPKADIRPKRDKLPGADRGTWSPA